MQDKLLSWIKPIVNRNSELREEVQYLNVVLGTNLPHGALFDNYRPDAELFLNGPDGVHGVGHSTRVLILTELLSRMYLANNPNSIDIIALREAARFHDMGRIYDSYDSDHGVRGAELYLERSNGHVDSGKVAYLVEWHVPDDKHAPEMIPELAILKDADALDRARVQHKGYGLNPKFLRTKEAKKLIITAEHLFLVSHGLTYVNGSDEYRSVIHAAKAIEIVK
ncbi:HD domain-containing protein [Candidatus Woesearchaeota archaeon]|jgi:hypothetical protein|nr:HD domain-containing protein [Candidatus Woesearchaeota archaeon]MBT5272682.1 HD domain-containing protein [Candidatus Woesearchaeota archaeon]MBT6041289.1 HD domain-containing protein [Candidatus Woesearchaeota archaeon]MBT6337073.1 HD domain-containing protein [Candidatus Woesearchaeota archaeon]MBT7927873.1 HD domain-containing protein [Candidatus Woesearchaeota archaeon]